MTPDQPTFEDIDRHLAALVASLGDGADDGAPLAAAVTSALTREGHICLDLDEMAGSAWPAGEGSPLPDLGPWLAALEASPAVGRAGDRAPLVLDGRRLYLRRLHALETGTAAGILDLGRRPGPPADVPDAVLERHFADEEPRRAARAALAGRLCCISGGPGTGKTTIVGRILALFLELGLVAAEEIALTAPTGKAAARLQQAVRDVASPPLAATTIHRWLLAGRGSTRLLVIDEASMVDITLMARVLAALDAGAGLIMLGDSSQLASVQPGSVFADLCASARLAASPLRSCVVELTKNWRFSGDGGIGRLAEAIRDDDADRVVDALLDPNDDEVELRPLDEAQGMEHLAGELTERHFEPLVRGMRTGRIRPDGTFDPFRGFRVLCAHRHGPFGSARFNRIVERLLQEQGLGPPQEFYAGRPVLVTRNSHRLGVSNGDTGIVVDGGRSVLFPGLPGADGRALLVPPGRLPDHESFFATTVHRAQGSEFDDVAVIPGPADSRLSTRELLYTAVTRARRRVIVHGTADSVRAAVGRRTRRFSGLPDLLAAAGEPATRRPPRSASPGGRCGGPSSVSPASERAG